MPPSQKSRYFGTCVLECFLWNVEHQTAGSIRKKSSLMSLNTDASEHSPQSFEFEHQAVDIIWNFLKFSQFIECQYISYLACHKLQSCHNSKYKIHMTYMMLDGVRSNRVMYMNINLKENLYCWKNLDFLASIKLYLLVLVYMHFQLYTIELGSLTL